MNPLPYNTNLPVNLLASVFNRTTATYKFYWFISILEILAEKPNKLDIPIRSILTRMICNAWYPVHYFKISFGVSDRLRQNIIEIQKHTEIPFDASKEKINQILTNTIENRILNLVLHFNKCVPYRFLSPWFPKTNDRDVVKFSSKFLNRCLYKIDLLTEKIQINPDWENYLIANNKILKDFCYWNLIQYLQTKNSNVPNIANKLIKPITRDSMVQQRKYWDLVFNSSKNINCIYTREVLSSSDYALEHFIPWSFVSHNLIWNIVPVTRSVNSSKSNRLPDINHFFEPFVNVQKKAIQTVWRLQPRNKILEDYLVLGETIPIVANMPMPEFQIKYQKLIMPLIQIAENMGFEYWKDNT